MSPKLLTGLFLLTACGRVLAITPPDTITYQGSLYKLSNSSTCADGTSALRLNSWMYCPAAAKPPTFSANLKWTIPVSRVDGTPLPIGELAGYQIYYTADDPSNSGIVNVTGGGTASYIASQLIAGNYYFTISAIDIFGTKSSMSNLVSIKLGP